MFRGQDYGILNVLCLMFVLASVFCGRWINNIKNACNFLFVTSLVLFFLHNLRSYRRLQTKQHIHSLSDVLGLIE